jgi:hypothetical protein
MKNLVCSILIVLAISACADETLTSCEKRATVRDLTGLDGCGFVFELVDGTRLEPIRIGYCGTPPLSKEITGDPLFDFEFVDGKEVFISYELSQSPSICMVGPTVKITCLTEVSSDDDPASVVSSQL